MIEGATAGLSVASDKAVSTTFNAAEKTGAAVRGAGQRVTSLLNKIVNPRANDPNYREYRE